MKRNCKTCTLNTTNDTVETCKRMCYLRYSKQRNKRICDLEQRNDKLKQTLIEIKEVLQFYNNTTIGVDKGNGIFELEVSNDNIGKLIYCYDTNPAKEALQKISEVEDG